MKSPASTTCEEPPRPELRDDGAYVFHYPPKFLWTRWPGEARRQQWGDYHVYVHVPFCRRICTFCTFERLQLQRGSIAWFTGALERELELVAAGDDFSQARVQSVYLGGGTASLLPNAAIGRLLEIFRARFGLRETVETTLECEPGTKTAADFAELRTLGINRVSLGFQAFQDHHLRALNRGHTVATAVATFEAARSASMANLHLDLMYGLPGHRPEEWEESVASALALRPTHLSAYRLIVFDGELLARKLRAGECQPLPPPESIEQMRLHLVRRLTAAGYRQYSLTEFCLPGYECRYVTSNWDGSDYLGFGPGGYSRRHRHLWEDDVFHEYYDEALCAGRRPIGKAMDMAPREMLLRDLAMGLCLLRVHVPRLEQRAGTRIDPSLRGVLDDLRRDGLTETAGEHLQLTPRGIRYASTVMRRIIGA